MYQVSAVLSIYRRNRRGIGQTRSKMATQEENRVGVGRESMIDGSLEWEWVVVVEKMLAEDNPHSRSIEEKRLEKQSIYLVPEWLKRTDIKAYQPQLVSLGPFHYGDSNLLPMEVHKRRALVHLIKRSKKPLQDFIHAINEVAGEPEAAYGKDLDENLREDRRRFVDVMLTDGCFLLEIMSKNFQDYEPHDPIFSRHGRIGIFPLIRSDMLLIENQLPLLVLKKILGVLPPDYLVVEMDHMEKREEVSFEKRINLMVLEYLGRADQGRDVVNMSLRCHPLELYHGSLTYNNGASCEVYSKEYKYEKMPSALKMNESGIKFRQSKTDQLLDIHFESGILCMHGVLTLPVMRVDEGTESLYLNLIAFERLHVGAGHLVTAYVSFMDDMIVSAKDVAMLSSSGVLENMLSCDEEAAKLFNGTLSRGQVSSQCRHRHPVRYSVKAYCHEWWPTQKRTYFKNPWASVSLAPAAIALVATLLQTAYTVKPNNS